MRRSAQPCSSWLKVLKKPLSWGVLAKLSLFLEANGREGDWGKPGLATVCPGSLNVTQARNANHGAHMGHVCVPTLKQGHSYNAHVCTLLHVRTSERACVCTHAMLHCMLHLLRAYVRLRAHSTSHTCTNVPVHVHAGAKLQHKRHLHVTCVCT